MARYTVTDTHREANVGPYNGFTLKLLSTIGDYSLFYHLFLLFLYFSIRLVCIDVFYLATPSAYAVRFFCFPVNDQIHIGLHKFVKKGKVKRSRYAP
jgi:hypothetical protein